MRGETAEGVEVVNTCGTCKHWGKDDFPYFAGLKPCLAVMHDVAVDKETDGDGCYVDGGGACYVATGGTPMATVSDGSGYFAALKTREDFGCRLWEPKS